MPDLPVAAPDPDKALGSLVALLETIGQGRALLPNGSLLLEVDADVNDEALWKSDASMLLDQDDLAALRNIPALLAERQQDKADVELALDGIPDPMHPDLRRWAYKLTDAKVLLAHVAGHDDPGNVEDARAALAVEEDAHG